MLQSSDVPIGDAYGYDIVGLSISQGKGYVISDGEIYSRCPPFYPFFLSIVYRFFGHSYVAVRIVQSIIGALNCVLIYLIGKKVIGIAAGGIASFISIFYPPFIKSSGLLLTELLFTFLLSLVVFYLLKIQEEMKLKDCFILGLLLGVSLLTRSVMMLFPIFIILLFIYQKKRHFFKRYIVVILFFSLSIMPWVIRNYVVYQRFVPASPQGGFVFYSSYCPENGIFGFNALPDDPVIVESNRISSPVLRSDFLMRKTLEFIINNPKKVLILEFKKILYFWAPFDWEMVGGRWFNFVYVAILPFFALGFFTAIKEFRKNYPILLPIIYFQIMTLIFYGSPRFRLPIDPFLFILAAYGILQSWRWINEIKHCDSCI